MTTKEYANIAFISDSKTFGTFWFTAEGLNYKAANHKAKFFEKNEIGKVSWTTCGTRCMVHVILNSSKTFRFDGFSRNDKEELFTQFLQHLGLEVSEMELSRYALNIGDLSLENTYNSFEMKFDGKRLLDFPFKGIAQCALPNKNEIEIQFEDDDTANAQDEVLVQMRLQLPLDEGPDHAEEIKNKIIEKAGIRKSSGNIICTLDETICSFLTPRGKYVVELFDTFFSMQGKTYNYKVTFNSIKRLFLLDHVYGTYFVISLRRPITQGQQRYHHLVMSLTEKAETLELNLTAEELEEKYDNQLTAKLEGPLPKIVARLFKALTGKKVFIPGSFRSSNESKCVRCALKSTRGYLYPLNQSFFFVHKPATYIRYEEIDFVEFLRLDVDQTKPGANQLFDFEVTLKSIDHTSPDKYMFNNLEKGEFPNLYNYLKKKGVQIKNFARAENSLKNINTPAITMTEKQTYTMDIDDDESDDSDFDEDKVELSSSSSDSDDSDDSASSKAESVKSAKQPKKKKRKVEPTSTKKQRGEKSSKKKKKDPKFPKKGKTAYIFFATQKGKEIKEANPSLSQPDVMRKAGEAWKAATAEDKAPFEKLALEDKERFKKELESYEPSPGFDKQGKPIAE